MSPQRYAQIKEIVAGALEREPRQRSQYLAAACNGDERLRGDIDSLLALESAPNVLDDPLFDRALNLSSLLPAEGRKHPGGDAMREMIQCPQGHQFDPQKNSSCPHCGVQQNVDKTAPKKEGRRETSPKDAAPRDGARRTEPLIRKELGLDPVVGWLVAVAGPDRGRSFPLFTGKNSIGRAEHMRVVVNDPSVSREHAEIGYDLAHNIFKVYPSKSNYIYLDDVEVDVPKALKAHDRIKLGNSQLMFVPLCGDSFKWE